ncbi:MAG: twin-arginine translocase TatA/TatE family subunit [Chloroflexota bacterium]|nr:twin-arginine translocase TatA/TatE family subunit [Chloroflexota bacterium]
MNFLGIGPLELLVILVVILIFVGPSRLPEIASQAGKAFRKFKEASNELTRDFQGMADEVKDIKKEAKNAVNPTVGLGKEAKEIANDNAQTHTNIVGSANIGDTNHNSG